MARSAIRPQGALNALVIDTPKSVVNIAAPAAPFHRYAHHDTAEMKQARRPHEPGAEVNRCADDRHRRIR